MSQGRKGNNGAKPVSLPGGLGPMTPMGMGEAVDQEQAEIARIAWRKYGKGRHPANLDYGDCFSYALAKASGSPLLYKGTDFSLTDIA